MKKKTIDNQSIELIHIEERNGEQVVSARELYQKLGYDKSQWARWYRKNITENEFAIEHEDWEGFDIMSSSTGTQDFMLKVDFAKCLAMLARTEHGELIRKYFIEVEKRAKALFFEKHHSPASDRELHLAHALQLATDFINDTLSCM